MAGQNRGIIDYKFYSYSCQVVNVGCTGGLADWHMHLYVHDVYCNIIDGMRETEIDVIIDDFFA